MLVHYAVKANSFSVYLPLQYAYPNEGNFTFDRCTRGLKLLQ